MGAMGFAAAKATGPGAGAAGCLEAPQPILRNSRGDPGRAACEGGEGGADHEIDLASPRALAR